MKGATNHITTSTPSSPKAGTSALFKRSCAAQSFDNRSSRGRCKCEVAVFDGRRRRFAGCACPVRIRCARIRSPRSPDSRDHRISPQSIVRSTLPITRRRALRADPIFLVLVTALLDHFTKYIRPNGFKAQVVACSREVAVLYHETLERLNAPPSAVIISASHKDDQRLVRHHTSEDERKTLLGRFLKKDGAPCRSWWCATCCSRASTRPSSR